MQTEVLNALEKIANSNPKRVLVSEYRKLLTEAGMTEELTEKGLAKPKAFYVIMASNMLKASAKPKGRAVPMQTEATEEAMAEATKEAMAEATEAVALNPDVRYVNGYSTVCSAVFAKDGYEYPGAWVDSFLLPFPWSLSLASLYTRQELIVLADNPVIGKRFNKTLHIGISRSCPSFKDSFINMVGYIDGRPRYTRSKKVGLYRISEMYEWWLEQRAIVELHGAPLPINAATIKLIPIDAKIGTDGLPYLYTRREVVQSQKRAYMERLAKEGKPATRSVLQWAIKQLDNPVLPCPFEPHPLLGQVITSTTFNTWLEQLTAMVSNGTQLWATR